jgi:hypothetical protein
MLIEIENGRLYVNGKQFCLYDDRTGIKCGDYNVIAVNRGGNTYPYIVGCDTVLHGEESRDAGVLVAEFIVDGAAIGSRAKIAHLVKMVMQEVDSGGKVVLEVS